MEGCTVSHTPVFVTCRIQWVPWTGAPTKVSSWDSFAIRTLSTNVLPSRRKAERSSVRNSSWTMSAAMRCPVMTQDAVQFSGAVFTGSGRAGPACFTGRRVTPLPSVPSPRPWKRLGVKVSTGLKASLMPEVTRYTNYHSCWSDFCSPA